jgi:hypothetical protein
MVILGQSSPKADLAPYVALQLLLQKQAWMSSATDINGYRVQVTIQTNKYSPTPQTVEFDMTFDEMQRGDR